MESKLVFLFDGECPFCNKFAELIELKSNIPNIKVKDARKKPLELPMGYDMDKRGAILLKDGQVLTGASAINLICNEINDPSDRLLKLLTTVFLSPKRTNFIFPFLLIARRCVLIFKGVPRKLSS